MKRSFFQNAGVDKHWFVTPEGSTGKALSVLGPGLALHCLPPPLCLAEVFCLLLGYSDVK